MNTNVHHRFTHPITKRTDFKSCSYMIEGNTFLEFHQAVDFIQKLFGCTGNEASDYLKSLPFGID